MLELRLPPRSVADFYREVMAALRSLNIEVKIWKLPVEVADPIPFDTDDVPAPLFQFGQHLPVKSRQIGVI